MHRLIDEIGVVCIYALVIGATGACAYFVIVEVLVPILSVLTMDFG